MRKLVVLSVIILVLGCASWAGAYTYNYSVSGDYGVFTNMSGDGSSAAVDLTLYYGNGSASAYYAFSTDTGSTWTPINNGGDGQVPDGAAGPGQSWAYSGVIADGGSFWLKFVGGSGSDMGLMSSSTSSAPYWFAYNSGVYGAGGTSTGCVAIVNGSPAVPIPAAVWLLGSGLGTLFVARRKRKV